MVTSAVPISLLNSTGISATEPRTPPAKLRRNQPDSVRRAQVGDDDAFTELFLEHKRRVFAICMKMVHEFSLAEDLTQETFLQLHRKIASFRGDSAFTTWLHRMTTNVVLMYLRKRVLPMVSLDQLEESVPGERDRHEFGARDIRQAGIADRLDISRALLTLAPGYKAIFLLHDVQGFQHWEIASMQDCSLGNSKSQLHKARRVLRGTLSHKRRSATWGLGRLV